MKISNDFKNIFKKCSVSFSLLILTAFVFACGKGGTKATMSLDGKNYDSIFITSGYYFDKATMSDAKLAEMLEKTEVIPKPANLGTVTLPDFSTIELTKNKTEEITEDMIEAEIEQERDKDTTYVEVKEKRKAKEQDKVTIDFKGYVDGEELSGGSGEDYELVLGSGQFIPGFEESVIGHTAGKKFTINVTFPENYTEELAGKPAQFDITIKKIEEATTPEVNEEFVKKHTTTGATTVDEYKTEIKQRIADRNDYNNKNGMLSQLATKLSEMTIIEPTEEALAWQFSVSIDQCKTQAKANNMSLENLFVSSVGSVKSGYDMLKSNAPESIYPTMLYDELCKKYKVEVTKEDVKKWFEKMSEAMGYGSSVTYEDYESYVGYESLEKAAKEEKLLTEVSKQCNIVEDTSDEKIENE